MIYEGIVLLLVALTILIYEQITIHTKHDENYWGFDMFICYLCFPGKEKEAEFAAPKGGKLADLDEEGIKEKVWSNYLLFWIYKLL